MYGKIHVCLKNLVLTKFDEETWNNILKESEFDETTDFLMFKSYPDEKTMKLITAVCKVSGLPIENVLEVFGQCWLTFCMDNGYEEMLRTLGADFTSFVQNLDALHAHLSRTYTKLLYPSFRCETNHDGTLTLHYYSKRVGFYYIVLDYYHYYELFSRFELRGLSCYIMESQTVDHSGCRVCLGDFEKRIIPSLARVLYNQKAQITLDQVIKQDKENGILDEHAIFTVKLTKMDGEAIQKSNEIPCIKPSVPKQTLIQSKQFCGIFPYHIVFDSEFNIKQCGSMIQILLNTRIEKGIKVTSLFELTHPRVQLSLENINSFINTTFMLSSIQKRNGHRLILKGQMRWMEDIHHMIFISSPCISSLEELKAMDIYISDIPLYDVTRELILLNQQRMAEMEIAKRLDETTAALTTMSKALEIEKKKTDDLLHEMLPAKVATELLAGRTVDAEKFESVTILFSDIVTFTKIASACTPMDIVNLLNNMYQRFDNLTTIHNVYKVETIGDAYMVVSGVPTRTKTHAENVANFSLDMVVEAGKVQCPATGKSIQIRVGFHSGSVVAGVVGIKMPRYCLFGDTVNTSSRMESHGIPSRVHVSPQSAELLIEKGYVFRDRGKTKIKGKGAMNTYILINRSGESYTEPDDDYRQLPIAKTVDMSIDVEVLLEKYKDEPPKTLPIEKMQVKTMSMSDLPIQRKHPPPLHQHDSCTCSIS